MKMKIMKICSTLYAVFFMALYVSASDPAPVSNDCKFWNTLAYNLSHIHEAAGDFLHMSCDNDCVNGMTCSAHTTIPDMPGGIHLDSDFCFGIRLNHCDSPVSMNYYLVVPNKNVSMAGVLNHNDSIEIPGLKMPGELIPASMTILVQVELVHVNTSFVLFGIKGRVKVTIGPESLFPYEAQVFPPMYIATPPCATKTTVKPPFPAPAKCVGPAPPAITTLAPGKSTPKPGTTTPKPVVIKSKTYNGPCESGLYQCIGPNEMCKINSDNDHRKAGVCTCDTHSTFDNKFGVCVKPNVNPGGKSTSKPPQVTVPSVTQASKSGSTGGKTTKVAPPVTVPSVTQASKSGDTPKKFNYTAVIIGSIVGGVLLIVIIASVIVCIGRRRRHAIYRDRQQLLTDDLEIGDDDDNMII